jgi:hypothetical protein
VSYQLDLVRGQTTISFMGDTSPFLVMDGGFDIGMPRRSVDVSPVVGSMGALFVPTNISYDVRIATIKFEVKGATKGAVLENINNIREVIRSAEAREQFGLGDRVELRYKWDGSNVVTYFEVYSGDLIMPDDIISVEKQFIKKGGDDVLPDLELRLMISPMGYGVSVFSEPTPLPVSSYYTARTTGYVQVKGSRAGEQNWVGIDDTDLPGSDPYLTKITVNSPITGINSMYLGLRQAPYPTVLNFEGESSHEPGSGTNYNCVDCSNGAYRQMDAVTPEVNYSLRWLLTNATLGMFYGFYFDHNSSINMGLSFSIGMASTIGQWVASDSIESRGVGRIPISAIPIFHGVDKTVLDTYGIDPDTIFFIKVVNEDPLYTVYNIDRVYLLPIDNGLRIWSPKADSVLMSNYATGLIVDDSWRNLLYRLSPTTNYYSNPHYGMLEPLKLEARKDQRIYFETLFPKDVDFQVKVDVVPTFETMAY